MPRFEGVLRALSRRSAAPPFESDGWSFSEDRYFVLFRAFRGQHSLPGYSSAITKLLHPIPKSRRVYTKDAKGAKK